MMKIFSEYQEISQQGSPKGDHRRHFVHVSRVFNLEVNKLGRGWSKCFRQASNCQFVRMVNLTNHSLLGEKCLLFVPFAVFDNEIRRLISHFDHSGHADFIDSLLVCRLIVQIPFLSLAKSDLTIGASNPIASIKANIDNAFEEDKIRLWELEGLKLGSEQVPIFSEEVFKQNRVHCARLCINTFLLSVSLEEDLHLLVCFIATTFSIITRCQTPLKDGKKTEDHTGEAQWASPHEVL